MIFAYTVALILALAGLAILDRRFKLAFWHNKKRTMLTILSGTLVFVVWDIAGILLGIFKHGTTAFSLPYTLLPEFPLEEILFLGLLCYTTLVLYRGMQKLCSPT